MFVTDFLVDWWEDMSDEERQELAQAWFRKNTLPVIVTLLGLIITIAGYAISSAVDFGGQRERTASQITTVSQRLDQLAIQVETLRNDTGRQLDQIAKDRATTDVQNAKAQAVTATTLSGVAAAIQDMRTEAAADRVRRDNQFDRQQSEIQDLKSLSVPSLPQRPIH